MVVSYPFILYEWFAISSIDDLYGVAGFVETLLEGWDAEVEQAESSLGDAERALAEAVDAFEWSDGDLDRFFTLLSYIDSVRDEELLAQLETLFWAMLEAEASGESERADNLREQFDNPEIEF